MKLLPVLLINIACVAGGLFLYDNLRSDPAPAPVTVVGGAQSRTLVRPEPVTLSRTTELAMLRQQADAQARTIQELEKRLVAWTQAAADRRRTGGPLAGLAAEGEEIDAEQGPFREGTILALRSYLAEIRRRDVKERKVQRIAKIIKAAGVELTDDTREPVISETIGYQERARDIMHSPIFPHDEAGMEQRRKAFEDLRSHYADQIRKMLPIEDADKLLESRLAQTAGYFRRSTGR